MKQTGLMILIMVLIPSLLMAGTVAHVCHNELSSWIRLKKKLTIVDVQSANEFRAHNYEGSLPSGNDPLRLKKIASRLQSTKGSVIVVSTTGGSDAVQAAELLVRHGVKRARILVLEGGMEAAATRAVCDCCKPAALDSASK